MATFTRRSIVGTATAAVTLRNLPAVSGAITIATTRNAPETCEQKVN